MKNIFFTSDHHFGHKNIIKFSNRPFASVEEMDETMIERWNEKVNPEDEVYHLGDVALCSPSKLRKILARLNGKIYLIKGNHEKAAMECADQFEWVKDYYELTVEDEEFHEGKNMIILLHYGMRVWNASHWGTYHLYGHSHGTLPDDPKMRAIDVGVDCHDFYPLSYEEVKVLMKKKEWTPPFSRK